MSCKRTVKQSTNRSVSFPLVRASCLYSLYRLLLHVREPVDDERLLRRIEKVRAVGEKMRETRFVFQAEREAARGDAQPAHAPRKTADNSSA